jgi:hypothetical protein
MMRQLVDHNRKPKRILEMGQWKSISRDRVLLTPGPPEAVATIRLAFDLYTKERKSRHQIVEILNIEKRFRGRGPWTLQRFNDLLMGPDL